MSVAVKNALRQLWGLAWLACAVIALPVAANVELAGLKISAEFNSSPPAMKTRPSFIKTAE